MITRVLAWKETRGTRLQLGRFLPAATASEFRSCVAICVGVAIGCFTTTALDGRFHSTSGRWHAVWSAAV